MAVQDAPHTTIATSRKPPAYRRRKGYTQAIVTLTDAVTKRRKDYWLGEYGTPESRELYYRVLAEYESLGRRLPDPLGAAPAAAPPAAGGPDIDELALEYWRRVAREFLPKRCNAIKATLRLLRQMDGSTRVAQYGPKRLRLLREAMIAGDPAASPPRRPWSRTTVNDRVRIVVAVFRWGVTQEIEPASVADALGMLDPLKRGRSRAKEGKKVGPVSEFLLESTVPRLPSPVRAMVRLQLLTGARPGEVVGLRGCDIDRDGRTGLHVEAHALPLIENAAALTAARIDLLPHQVVLTHRIATSSPRRFLIADEVGLGKTIETALVLRELASRGELITRMPGWQGPKSALHLGRICTTKAVLWRIACSARPR